MMRDFDRWRDDFLTYLHHNEGRGEATIIKYGGHLDRLKVWAEAQNTNPLQLGLADLEQFAGLHAHEIGLSSASRRPLVASLRGFFKYLATHGARHDNPAAGLPYPKAAKRIPVAMSLDSAEKLIMAADVTTFKGLRDATILAVFYGAGLRVGGLVNMNESDLIWSPAGNQKQLSIRVREKGNKERLIPVPYEAALYVEAYLGALAQQDIDRYLPDGDQVLFVSLRNRTIPMHQYYGEARRLADRSVYEIFETVGKRAGIPREELHPHAARHMFGAELTEDEVHPFVLKELMGHESVETTQIYTKIATRRKREAVESSSPLSKIRTHMTPVAEELRARTKETRS